MDPRLLSLYTEELAHLREMGGEFAQAFPKVARRLAMDGLEVADPYVERLLEGFAFMAARVRLKLDAEYPQFVAQLLESVAPMFLAPVPSAMVARLRPDLAHPDLARGAVVPRGSSLVSQAPRGQNTLCEFRTAQAVTLWPLEIVQAQVFTQAADLPVAALPVARQVRCGLRLRLRVHGGATAAQLPLDRLNLHFSAGGSVGYRLHELVGDAALGTLVWPVKGEWLPPPAAQWRPAAQSIALGGFAADEALLPETLQGYSAYRLLQELAMLPQRFLFADALDLRARLAAVSTPEFDWVVLCSRADPGLEPLVDAASLALHCTPALNLFPKRLDRIAVHTGLHEFHAVPDRTRPLDHEVHSIESVTGYGTATAGPQVFRPLYAAGHADAAPPRGYYTLRREPRQVSQRAQQQGTRSAYIGSEVHLSLVRPDGLPYDDDLRQLAIGAWVTNRDLPLLLGGSPHGEPNQAAPAWSLDAAGAVTAVDCLRGPTRPVARNAWGARGWSLVNQLTLNHLTLVGNTPHEAAAALRSVLALYGLDNDGWTRQLEALIGVQARAVTRRLPHPGPLSFGSGVQVELEVDELGFPNHGAYLFGCVLERYFARQSAINSFSETLLRSTTRGVIGRWAPRVGDQPLLAP